MAEKQKWDALISSEYQLFTDIQATGKGPIPDYIVQLDKQPIASPGKYQERRTDGDYSVTASRVPWRLTT